jgi:hypothetical protein
MKFPITVNEIIFEKDETLHEKLLFGGKCGDFVSVRPCDEELAGKTFLGVLIGEIALVQMAQFDEKNGALKISKAMHNPAIFVPALSRMIYGCGSWWGKIKSPEQLRKITDDDINNVWYVQALKQLESETTERPETK